MKRLVSYENLLSCITRDESHHVATLDWKAFLHLSPILRLRRREARAALRKYLSGLQGAKWEVDTVRFPIGSQIDEQALNSITGDIAGALDGHDTERDLQGAQNYEPGKIAVDQGWSPQDIRGRELQEGQHRKHLDLLCTRNSRIDERP